MPMAMIIILLATSCAASSGAAHDGMRNASASDSVMTVPFDAYLASVSAATYQEYADKPGVQVRDSTEFQQMRTFVLTKYQAAHVSRSYTDSGGGVFDCVQQGGSLAPAPASAPAGAVAGQSAPATSPTVGCAEGSVPTRRITLDDMVRFPTLRDYLGKSPDGSGQLPVPP
jgi:hypothetical protein